MGSRYLLFKLNWLKIIHLVPLVYKGFDIFKDLLDQAHLMLRLKLSNRWQTIITQGFVLKQFSPPQLL